MVCWLNKEPLKPGGKYAIKHTTQDARCIIKEVKYKVNINTLHRVEDDKHIGLNDIGRIKIRTTQPLFYDIYERNRATGSLIIMDEYSNETVAGGMII
jgi:sulfate adenylyltransferase subunit 1